MNSQQLDVIAANAALDIVADLCSRRGLRHEWDATDYDVQAEILYAWKAAIIAAFDRATSGEGTAL